MSEQIDACPVCNSGDLRVSAPSIQAFNRSPYKYRCNACNAGFDEPARRKRKGAGSRQGLTKRLLEADPDDVGGEA